MQSAFLFIVCVLIVAFGVLRWRIGDWEEILDYFDSERGRKIRNGIITFVGLAFLAVIIGLSRPARGAEAFHWFEYGEVYLGLDYTNRSPSPQCLREEEGVDERLTSNGGARINILQSGDRRFETNFKYTHHSCALNTDRNTYDGLGLEMSYRIW